MPKAGPSFSAGEYALVADRIALFYQRFPHGRIITELVSRSEREVTFKALVYDHHVGVAGTGIQDEAGTGTRGTV